MCRLRTNFARLGDPLQGLHIGNAPLSVAGATTSPSGGSTAAGGDRGAFPRAKRGCLVFAADRQQCRRRRHTNSSPVGQSTTLAATGCVKPKNPPADRPVNLKNLFPLNPEAAKEPKYIFTNPDTGAIIRTTQGKRIPFPYAFREKTAGESLGRRGSFHSGAAGEEPDGW